MTKQTSAFENGLIWFGAGVSIAEIITGTYFVSLGIKKAVLAIILGHIIGCAMLYFAGIIGGKTKKSSMETVKISFGKNGGQFFAILNILQLVGWTAIMIYDGAIASNGIFNIANYVWCLVIGGLIIVWILVGITNLQRINIVAMILLFGLTLVLCKVIFFDNGNALSGNIGDELSFGAAVELAVAMPLSWLPLISDYTKEAKNPKSSTLTSVIVYGIVSCFMYFIGMGAALFTEESDVAQIMLKAGLGAAGLLIVVFSTVTTTFLDAYSAGISSESVFSKIKGKYFAIAVTVIGTILAILFPMDDITEFLYLIGSVFAPMISILIADFFILKRDKSDSNLDIRNAVIWIVGFVIYRCLMNVDFILGYTILDMLLTIVLCIICDKALKKSK